MVEMLHDCSQTSLLLGRAQGGSGSVRRLLQVWCGRPPAGAGEGRWAEEAVGWLRTTGEPPGEGDAGTSGEWLPFPLPLQGPPTKGSSAPGLGPAPVPRRHCPPGQSHVFRFNHPEQARQGLEGARPARRRRPSPWTGPRAARAAGEAGHRHEARDGAEVGEAAPPSAHARATPATRCSPTGSRSWRTSIAGGREEATYLLEQQRLVSAPIRGPCSPSPTCSRWAGAGGPSGGEGHPGAGLRVEPQSALLCPGLREQAGGPAEADGLQVLPG